MITLQDCIALCGLTEEEVLAIAEYEHLPEIAATALANYLLHQEHGTEKVRDMIVDDIRQAQRSGDRKHVLTLLHVLHHFLKMHPEAKPSHHPWSEMRELAARNTDQAQAVYSQFVDAARRAQEMMKALIPPNPVVQALCEAQERALNFAWQNLDASFVWANELAEARDLTQALQILSRHAQLQMRAFALQAQELADMVTEAAKKAKL